MSDVIGTAQDNLNLHSETEHNMSKSILETDLAQAREKLAALQDKLPEYHGDVDTAESDVARLKAGNAPLAKQRAARVAAMASRDMKLEFEADIAAAQGRVTELELALCEERLIGQMSAAAEDAKKHRLKMDAAFTAAEDALHKAADLIWESWEAESEARKAFTEAGELFVPGFQSKSEPPWTGRPHDEVEPFRNRVNGLMDELQKRGVPVDYATDGETGRYNCIDTYGRHPLPNDPVALALWAALLRIKGPDARRFERFVPKPQGTVALPPHLTQLEY
jgi:DNA repair exonuclease SbcCD ATPase subunit